MTEHEYSKMQDALEARDEHRQEICNDCEHKAHSRADGKNYCTYNADGLIDGRPLDDMCACAPDGYCDKWHEGEWNYHDLSPEADAECKRLREDAKGFYVEDVNAYINDVNNFCYRVIAISKGGLVTTSDKLIMADMAKKLIKRTKKETNNGTKEEKH